ncbi:MAG: efflux transporter outer membrane subunit [Vibrio sp.]
MRLNKNALSLALSLFVLTGCSALVRSDFEQPQIQVPAQWQEVSLNQNVRLDPWWQRFNDPMLNQLVDQVLQTNNDLALATLTLKRAQLQTGLARDDWYPQVSAGTSGSVSQVLEQGDSENTFSANASVSYEVDLWGRIGAEVDAAKWSAMATLEDRESTAQSLVATTATLYWQILYLNESLGLAKQDVMDAQQTLKLTQSRYDAGAVSRLDLVEARRDLASQESQVSDIENQLKQANNALAILFDKPPQQFDLANQVKEKSLTQIPLPQVRAGVPSDVLIRRPDVKASLYTLKSALASKDATFAAYLPSLTLTGSIGDSSDDLKDLLSDPIGTLGAQMVLPFLQWNQMQINNDIADVDYQSAVISYRQVLYQAFQDVDNALADRQNYFYQAQKLQQQYTNAVEAQNIYQSRYQNGAIDLQDLIDAQEVRRNARDAFLANKFNQLSNQAVLYQALGGDDIAPKLADNNAG